jgi:predicted amidohydrolase
VNQTMEHAQKFTLALIQMAASIDPEANVDVAVSRVREAGQRGARVVCLPELFRFGGVHSGTDDNTAWGACA